MTDEKIFDLATKKPFELKIGSTGTSDQQITTLIDRFARYAQERKFRAVAIVMIDENHSCITGYHTEEGMVCGLAGGLAQLQYRIAKFMDDE
jgi:hypothetical protein